MYFPKKPFVYSCNLHLFFINIIPDAQVLYLPYTSFYSDQIPKVVTFGGYSCDICVSIPWCPSFGWRNGRDGYCLGNVRLSGWSFVAEKHRASSVGQPDRPLMTPHVSPGDFPLAVSCLCFAYLYLQKYDIKRQQVKYCARQVSPLFILCSRFYIFHCMQNISKQTLS